MTHRERGVSRIELLVWGAVLALLMAIILPKALDQIRFPEPESHRVAFTMIVQFQSAVELYTVDNGHPPTMAQGLDALIHEPVTEPRLKHWKKYLSDLDVIPKDPWGNPYIYRVPGPNGEVCSITSYGPDGKAGGGDDITSIKGGEARQDSAPGDQR